MKPAFGIVDWYENNLSLHKPQRLELLDYVFFSVDSLEELGYARADNFNLVKVLLIFCLSQVLQVKLDDVVCQPLSALEAFNILWRQGNASLLDSAKEQLALIHNLSVVTHG